MKPKPEPTQFEPIDRLPADLNVDVVTSPGIRSSIMSRAFEGDKTRLHHLDACFPGRSSIMTFHGSSDVLDQDKADQRGSSLPSSGPI